MGLSWWLSGEESAGDTDMILGSGRKWRAEGNGNDSSIHAWRIPWTEEPGWLQSMGSQKSQTQGHNVATKQY